MHSKFRLSGVSQNYWQSFLPLLCLYVVHLEPNPAGLLIARAVPFKLVGTLKDVRAQR